MKYIIETTPPFDRWLDSLNNKPTRLRIATRLSRVEMGNFGDHKQLGENLFELRFVIQGALRIYYTLRGDTVVILLVGGNKSSQSRDIRRARKIITELE